MGYDAMANDASVPAISRDLGKKKRANRSAKLKQCKLDARREQWLSQVKNKGCKATALGSPRADRGGSESRPVEEVRRATAARDGLRTHSSDTESPAQSPTEKASRKNCPDNSTSSGSSFGSCSRSVSDAEEEGEEIGEEKEGLDDWEAVADALFADSGHAHHHGQNSHPMVVPSDARPPPASRDEPRTGGTAKAIPRAWRPDDVFRPRSLPNLSKQLSFPPDMKRCYGGMGWAHHGILSTPTSCPICYEDLDLTDSSFLPCSCGFRLCLFCHKKILEDDARCPGCRKQYSPMPGGETNAGGGVLPISCRLSRSCSMISRS